MAVVRVPINKEVMSISKMMLLLPGLHKKYGDIEMMYLYDGEFVPIHAVEIHDMEEQYKRKTKDVKVVVLSDYAPEKNLLSED